MGSPASSSSLGTDFPSSLDFQLSKVKSVATFIGARNSTTVQKWHFQSEHVYSTLTEGFIKKYGIILEFSPTWGRGLLNPKIFVFLKHPLNDHRSPKIVHKIASFCWLSDFPKGGWGGAIWEKFPSFFNENFLNPMMWKRQGWLVSPSRLPWKIEI